LDSIAALAALYTGLLDVLALEDVVLIGNSIGGWITAEMMLIDSPRVRGAVLVDAVGIEVPGHPVADFFSLTLGQVAELSYHDPDSFRLDPSTLTPAQQTVMAGNRAALAVYGGTAMTDPGLADRLSSVAVPTLVVWGDADRIADPEYGRAYAAAIPAARFQLLAATGHVPQLETPQQLLRAISEFATAHTS
jgi:pimeloyl-ACP methyl ester carboxylesterase